MLIRNPNNDFHGNDEDYLYSPIELDEYSDTEDMEERFIPPIFNNPMDILFGPGGLAGGDICLSSSHLPEH